MANRLPELKIPVTVQTDGVDRGLSAVEKKLRNSAARMRRIQAASTPAAAGGGGMALKASQGTAFLGGIGKIGPVAGLLGGMGGVGMALAAPMAAFGFAAQQVQMLAQMTKGANEALAEFAKTGEQTFAVNSEYLKKLAALEAQAQAAARLPGYFEAFTAASATAGQKSLLDFLNEFGVMYSAFAGATVGGKNFETALLEAQLAVANEQDAKAIAAKLEEAQRNNERTILDTISIGGQIQSIVDKIGFIVSLFGKL